MSSKKTNESTAVATPQNSATQAGQKPTPNKKARKASKKGQASTPNNGYKRGSLSAAIWDHLDSIGGPEKADYEAMLKVAQAVKPDTKFDKYHYAWYRANYQPKVEREAKAKAKAAKAKFKAQAKAQAREEAKIAKAAAAEKAKKASEANAQ